MRRLAALALAIVPALAGCPSLQVNVEEMTDLQFEAHLESVEARWERRARFWLIEHPEDADDLARVADMLVAVAGNGTTGVSLTLYVEALADSEGVDPAVTLIVLEIIDAYEVEMRLSEADVWPEGADRWLRILDAAAQGVRKAAGEVLAG